MSRHAQTGTSLATDGNANGVIDTGDFDTWRANFGHSSPASASLAAAAVPEPISFGLLVIATTVARARSPRRKIHRVVSRN